MGGWSRSRGPYCRPLGSNVYRQTSAISHNVLLLSLGSILPYILIYSLPQNFFTSCLAVAVVRLHRIVVPRHVVVVVLLRRGVCCHRSTHRSAVVFQLPCYQLPIVGLVGLARCQLLVQKKVFTLG
jgi:hypothetical protein